MISLTRAVTEEAAVRDLIAGIDGGRCPAVISGVSGVHRAHILAAVRALTGRQVLAVCSDEREARRFASDLASLTGEPAPVLTGRDFTFYNAEGVSRQAEHARLRALYAVMNGAPAVVATAEGLVCRTMPPEVLTASARTVSLGGTEDMDKLASALDSAGYTLCDQVEGYGQYARRGGIMDFYSPAHPEPVRAEFFGDEIDSLSFFDPATQRRTEAVESAVILPAAESLPQAYSGPDGTGEEGLARALRDMHDRLCGRKKTDEVFLQNLLSDAERLENGRSFPAADRYMELIYSEMATAADYLQPDAVVFICEPGRTAEAAKSSLAAMAADAAALMEKGVLESSLNRFALGWEDACAGLDEHPVIMADSFLSGRYPLEPRALYNISTKQLSSYGGSLETAAGDISHYMDGGFRTVVLCSDRRRAELLRDFLEQRGAQPYIDLALTKLPEPGECAIARGALSAGMEYPSIKLAVITEGQILQEPLRGRKRRVKKPSNRERISSYTDLSPGDLVVHEHHGIGRYVGIFKMQVDGAEKDYVKIAYAGSDSLYVPATNLDLVTKYIGGGEDAPVKLSKMGGADWTRVKTRAKGAAKEMARELIALYAERQRRGGFAFAPDSVWQTEFEADFDYEETDDQLRSTEEIKRDMEKPVPMDRLLCGDVGYGKTEVALRAVMKCVLGGKQAAILVPTTVLAQQHYATIMNRFAKYPVKAEVLSRFRTPAQIKQALRGLSDGSVDIVVGTHRLLQKDVVFKGLGLLIVDEEQRFGVSHKERLKEISKQVDVLTLSATPIPRTLNMALSGIRDMSVIEEPPRNRQPVQTYVIEHDWGIIEDAIRRELGRGGQVYYLHNRIENIERTASRISAMFEGVTVAVAHGRMDQEQLGDVMERMAEGDIQVLVCTTIIETGIDIPNVNTLIIEDADRMGLAQLHQIRGRVGRSPRRAFAYLTFRRGKVLSEVAEKRLSAIREFAEFNAGFKIAMRDLEIRGAGNLLGAEQSGHMMSVGYDMYLKLLEEAVLEERGEKPKKRTECSAELTVSANIPERYVPSPEQRMDLYRRIAMISTEEDSDDMISELIDRYGDPPSETVALVAIALLRGEASRAGITGITQKTGWLRFELEDFDLEQISLLYGRPEFKGRVKIEAGTSPAVSLKLASKRVTDEASRFVRAYAECAKKQPQA